ncbi:MAG: GMP/IMP nucleotidase [Gammaproteobacteria bacterium]|nr:GMP/IMP nucleotidase [Gammaproteobacteria bacterium]MCF6229518.1 GMP/IMP nucleotidase [Gammaproteobacteria bacterium]
MIKWQHVDTVMLDMDGTLLDLNFDNSFWQQQLPQYYAKKHQLSFEEARHELMTRYAQHKGTLQWYCLDYWRKSLDIDLMMLKKQTTHLIKVLPHAIEFIDQLRQVGKRVLLVTNAHPDNLLLKMEVTQLNHHFDEIICSHDYGYCKEDQRFWSAFEQQHGFDAGRSLMVDDNLQVLASARKYGIAQLLAVRKPDSSRPETPVVGYPSVSDFSEIIPSIG